MEQGGEGYVDVPAVDVVNVGTDRGKRAGNEAGNYTHQVCTSQSIGSDSGTWARGTGTCR